MKPLYEQRLDKLRSHIAAGGHDALLVFSLDNLRYLYGYSGEAAYGIVTLSGLYLITDYRFEQQAREECVPCQVICRQREKQSLGAAIGDVLQAENAKRVLFEAEHVPLLLWQGVAADNSGIGFAPAGSIVEELRKRKDAWEVAQIKAAASIADQALAQVLPLLRPGVSERDIALELEYRMQRLGSEGLSFPTILGFGERSALPHGMPSKRLLQAGELVLFDFGAVVNGYRSDMTRTHVLGQPDARQQAMFDTVYKAQAEALAQLRAGVPAAQAAKASDAVLHGSEFARYAGPGLGHGVGIKLHEQPFMTALCGDLLHTDYVVTVEPGIYIPGYGGMRLEDDVLITQDGHEMLTHAPKQFELLH
jgi:Xaa-Pro aminopeptidase/Xaa-Pro dipeptidase